MARRTVNELLDAITDELKKGLIFEAQILGSKEHVEGLCSWETQEITVNPSVSVVDTLIHELLHRRFPGWSEERVRCETWRLIKRMSPDDIQRWYRKYQRMVKRKTKPVRLKHSEL